MKPNLCTSAYATVKPKRFPQRGFSLIWMSILITVASIIMVSILPGNEAGSYNAKSTADIKKLSRIEEAMRSFMATNGRRPCPADGQYPINTANFGKEAANPGACTGGTPAAPMGPDSSTTNCTNNTTGCIVAGTIPTRALGLPDEFAFDSYGRRFTYVVDMRATSHASCQNLEGLTLTNTTPTGTGGLIIKDIAGNTVDPGVMYAYIQHGQSGYGAWPESGSTSTLTLAQSVNSRVNSKSTDKWMQINAGVDVPGSPPGASGFTYNSTNFTNTRIQNSRTFSSTASGQLDTGFDDLLFYRNDLKNTCCLGPYCPPIGFMVPGPGAHDLMGSGAAFGDLNNDGVTDMAINAPSNSTGVTGAVYVIFGKRNYIYPDPYLVTSGSTQLNGSNGFTVTGMSTGCSATSVAIGDVNADGYPDLVIGVGDSYGALSKLHAIYVIYGQPSTYSWPASVNVQNIGTTVAGAVIQLPGSAEVTCTPRPILLSDINGDSYNGHPLNDIIYGENLAANSANGDIRAGTVYVIFGKGDGTGWQTGTYATPYNITDPATPPGTLDGSNGFVIHGTWTDERLGGKGIAAGDMNGDGVADLAIGDYGYSAPANYYVILGQKKGGSWSGTNGNWPAVFDLTTLNGNNGFTIINPSATAGAISGFADFNGDGIPDLLIDGFWYFSSPNAYVIWGQKLGTTWSSNWASSYTMGSFPAGVATKIYDGTKSYYAQGFWPAVIGDFNHDGIDDLAFAEPNETENGNANAGIVDILYGSRNSWPSTFDLSTITSTTGFKITGCNAGDQIGYAGYLGWGMTSGDLTGDGYPELFIDAPLATYNGNTTAGIGYVVYGKKTPRPYGSLSLCGL